MLLKATPERPHDVWEGEQAKEAITELMLRVSGITGSTELPGEVMMSGLDTLRHETKVATLGFNPGGSRLPALVDQFESYISNPRFQRGYSAYEHQCWHEGYWPHSACPKCDAGTATPEKHQRRVKEYCRLLGAPPVEVLSLNAIFFQTPRVPQYVQLAKYLLRAQAPEAAHPSATFRSPGLQLFLQEFWPIHEWLLAHVTGVRVLLCLGNGVSNSAFAYVKAALQPSAQPTVDRPYRDGRYFWHGPLLVLGVGHPSLIEVSAECRRLLAVARLYVQGECEAGSDLQGRGVATLPSAVVG